MAYNFPDGARILFSGTFATAKTVASFTNANPGVATSTTHGFVDGDELLLVTNWEDATDSVYRADSLTADTLSLTGLDTSNTRFFPVGSGAGSTLQKVSSWVEIPQVLTIDTSGGDARLATISPLARRTPINVALGTNPVSVKLMIGHDPSNATFLQMLSISKALTKVAIKLVLADGATTYGYGNMMTQSFPKLQNGQTNQAEVSISLLGRDVAYGV